jgi:hypothetical protein
MKRVLFAVLLTSCLPEDTRPTPGVVNVQFRGGEATIKGFDTIDGWHVGFDRVLVTIGGSDIEGEACTEYADADYFRIMDGLNATPQKVGQIYGLGTCSLELRARNPELDTLLGVGVTDNDKIAMRTPESDSHEQNSGITFWVRGYADRMGVHKSFEWKFRRRRVRFDECEVDGVDTFTLAGDQEKTIEVRVHAEVLMQDHPRPKKTRLRFDPIASADANGDGVVTLEELDTLTLADAGIDLSDLPEAANAKSMGDLVYDGLFPQLMRVGETGLCSQGDPNAAPRGP